jgi:polyhydroxyalkanoate synthesis regulator phasin
MKLRSRTTLAVGGAALAIGAGAGGALAAAGGGGSDPGTPATVGGPGLAIGFEGPGPGKPDLSGGIEVKGPPGAIAASLGLTENELRTQLESGKTLAQIASAQGKSVSGLKDVIYSDAKTNLDQAVADGKLTAAQEQAMLAEMKSHLDDIVNGTGPKVAVKGADRGPFGDAAATYLGLSPAELQTQLENGKTLAQVAADQGKSVDGLKAAILAGAKADLDQAVDAGKITAAQEQQMLDDLKSHVDDLVNGVGFLRKTVPA